MSSTCPLGNIFNLINIQFHFHSKKIQVNSNFSVELSLDILSSFIMLSDRFYTLAFLTFKSLEYVGFVPMKFDMDTKLFVKSDRGLSLLKLHLLPAIAWVIFVFCQSFRFYESGELDEFNLNVTCTLMGILSLEIFITSIYYGDESISS